MTKHLPWFCGALLLFGCASGFAPLTKSPKDKSDAKPDITQTASSKASKEKSKPEVSYKLSAQASGPCISFAVANQGDKELTLSPYDFALIPRGTRQVVAYDPQVATIEVEPLVRPGETVRGRALFHEFKSPDGHRLVFKPRSGSTPEDAGTFVVVKGGGQAPATPHEDESAERVSLYELDDEAAHSH